MKILIGYNGLTLFWDEIHKVPLSEFSIGVLMGQVHNIAILSLIFSLIYLIYEISFLSSKLSATPGKLISGLEVVCYEKSNFQKIIIRSLIKAIAILIPPLAILLFIISALSKTKQSLHDKLSNTCVIENNQKNGTNPQMTLEEFFEEMKSRGLRMYSEQRALAQEIYGTPVPLARYSYQPASRHTLIGVFSVFVLVFSIALSISFAFYFLPDIQILHVLY